MVNITEKRRKIKVTKYTAYLLFSAGSRYGADNIKKIAEASTLEEIRKRARAKRREFSRRTGEWAQIIIDRDNMFYEML